MNWLTVLLGVAAFAASVSARCLPFHLKIANSPNTAINGFYLENQCGVGTFNAGLEMVVGCFSDTSHELFVTPSKDGQDIFLLVPIDSSGVENLLFGDHSPGVRELLSEHFIEVDFTDLTRLVLLISDFVTAISPTETMLTGLSRFRRAPGLAGW